MKQPDGVGAAADTGSEQVREATNLLARLLNDLATDDAVEIAHQHRIRVGAGHRADDIERVVDIGHPIAHRFIQRVFEGTCPAAHRHHFCAEQFHSVDIGRLALNIINAHVDHAFQTEPGGDGGTGDAVLTGACLGNDARLSKVLGQQGLPHRVVDLMGASVIQVFALEPDLRPAPGTGQTARVVQR